MSRASRRGAAAAVLTARDISPSAAATRIAARLGLTAAEAGDRRAEPRARPPREVAPGEQDPDPALRVALDALPLPLREPEVRLGDRHLVNLVAQRTQALERRRAPQARRHQDRRHAAVAGRDAVAGHDHPLEGVAAR